MTKKNGIILGVIATSLTLATQAQAVAVDAATEITTALPSVESVFNGIATISIAALVLGLILRFARKGNK